MKLDLTSERLLLRPLAESDLDLAIELFTDPAVMKHVEGVSTKEEIAKDLPRDIQRGAGGAIGVWCVVERVNGEKLGTAILLPLPIDEREYDRDLATRPDLPDVEVEIGYLLKRTAWGRGYATDRGSSAGFSATRYTVWPSFCPIRASRM